MGMLNPVSSFAEQKLEDTVNNKTRLFYQLTLAQPPSLTANGRSFVHRGAAVRERCLVESLNLGVIECAPSVGC